ncbi:HNH endonuclease signature motif containing protein [Dietzia sp. B32]|uniref:HNH endonuclease n=1 Tax=Dietzia sp. B32 TaxID=2915130 RepID=UPI0021ADA3A3|nr:HNH endonuclease signature motif containing protein [Dietzia sp. B32]UVE96729.1 HNH endonuclease [Dietzia sp. B32]
MREATTDDGGADDPGVDDPSSDDPSAVAASPSVTDASSAAVAALHAENRAAAARLRACHDLWAICREEQELRDIAAGYGPGLDQRPEHAVIDPLTIATSQIVAAYGVHHNRARNLLTLAITLVTKFPDLVEAMDTGRLDEATATLLARQMRTVDSLHRDDVQREVIAWLLDALAAGRRPGRDAILSHTDRIIAAHDPAGVRLRRAAAVRARRIRIRRGPDGMADLHAHLTATEAFAIHTLLQTMATDQHHRDRRTRVETTRRHGADSLDPEFIRSMDELRADALVATLLGTTTNQDTATGPDAAAGTGGGHRPPATQIRPTITVLAPPGPDGDPEVYLPRGGPATIDALIELLSRSTGATITVPDTEPGTADTPHGARRYRISADLARRIRLRDGTCRHPGCSVPADDCDIDHVRPFNHTDPTAGGPTTENNLACLCRHHHRFKTFHGWHYHLAHDGTLTVTTDTGHTITTHPDGPLARWRHRTTNPDHAAGTDSDSYVPPPRRPWLDPRPQSTHWHRRAQRLAAERKANTMAPQAQTHPDGPDHDTDPPPF